MVVVRRNPSNRWLTSSTNLKKQEKWTSINQLGDTNHQQHPPNTGSNETTDQQSVPVQRVPIPSVPLLSLSDESQTLSQQVDMYKNMLREAESKHEGRLKDIQRRFSDEITLLIQQREEEAKYAQADKEVL